MTDNKINDRIEIKMQGSVFWKNGHTLKKEAGNGRMKIEEKTAFIG
jgi:hypothetical protein